MEKGCIHIYHGDGKGKTTCAIGLAIRALGAGYHVIFAQFLKGDDSSELMVLKQLEGVEVMHVEKKYNFTWLLPEEEKRQLKRDHINLFQEIEKKVKFNDAQTLLVLDEMCATYELGLINQKQVLGFLNEKPAHIEVVITGRNPDPALVSIADYISEIKKEKHPMDNGVEARIGIEM